MTATADVAGSSPNDVTYDRDTSGVDWHVLTERLRADDFDNGRTPDQLRQSFENCYSRVFAVRDGKIVGKARALSDGVCNGYVVDVWTHAPHRRQGIAREMMRRLLADLEGQHVLLIAENEVADFYAHQGFAPEPAMSKVVGRWLQISSQDPVCAV